MSYIIYKSPRITEGDIKKLKHDHATATIEVIGKREKAILFSFKYGLTMQIRTLVVLPGGEHRTEYTSVRLIPWWFERGPWWRLKQC